MKNFLFILGLIFTAQSFAQKGDIEGVVLSNDKPVPFARIKIQNTSLGAVADSAGFFKIQDVPFGEYVLEAAAMGFEKNQLTVKLESGSHRVSISLNEQNLELNSVVITGTMREISLSRSPVKIEVLSANFFKINPVNSIIEALQTVNGVQEQVNCGVCGTNDIHINGMEGPYTLVLIDGMPIVSGLSSVYGFNGIPTSLIQRVEIVKGPSSTLYGTEAVGGVINIITKTPQNTPLLDLEINGNTHQEFKTNFAVAPKIGKRIFTSLSADYYYNQNKMDFNGDNFTDIPLSNRLSVFNKWQLNDKKGNKVFSLAGRYYWEDRFGGTLPFTPDLKGSDLVYGEHIHTERIEIIGSYQLPRIAKNWRFDFSANSHFQNSFYGNVNYRANQQVYFSNLIWDKKIKKRHQLLLGITNKYQIYEDNTTSATDDQNYVPGVFVQDEFNVTDQLILLGGTRFDYHQKHGLIFSPRLSVKKQFGTYTAFRFNYGNGFRQVQLFTEDHAFVSGSRQVLIVNELKPERSHNVTLNLNHTYTLWGYGNFDVDLFYTYFLNKIVPDFEQDPQLIVYDNLKGYGTTRGVSMAVNDTFKIPFNLRVGATFQDVFEIYNDEIMGRVKNKQLFAPVFSGTFGLGYDWKKIGLSFNYTGRVMGHQLLPTFAAPFERPEVSPWFTVQNIQVTKKFKSSLEIYLGVKNILNYTQPSPLIDPQNPFGDNFDASYAYGPLQTRRFLLGIRYSVPRKK